MLLNAKITKIGPVELIGKNNLEKQILQLIEIGEDGNEMIKNPDKINVDVLGSMVDYVKPFKLGDYVKCGIALGVNEHNGKEYNNVRLYAITGLGKTNKVESSEIDLPF